MGLPLVNLKPIESTCNISGKYEECSCSSRRSRGNAWKWEKDRKIEKRNSRGSDENFVMFHDDQWTPIAIPMHIRKYSSLIWTSKLRPKIRPLTLWYFQLESPLPEHDQITTLTGEIEELKEERRKIERQIEEVHTSFLFKIRGSTIRVRKFILSVI